MYYKKLFSSLIFKERQTTIAAETQPSKTGTTRFIVGNEKYMYVDAKEEGMEGWTFSSFNELDSVHCSGWIFTTG